MPTVSDQGGIQQATENIKDFSQTAKAGLEALQSITTGLQKLDTDKLANFGKSMRAVAAATEKLDPDKLARFGKAIILAGYGLQNLDTDRLANFGKGLRSVAGSSEKLDTSRLSSFSEAITLLATAVKSALGKLDATKFASFAKSIRSTTTALGKLDANKAAEFASFGKSIRAVSAASERLSTDNLANFPKAIRAIASASGRLNTDKTDKLSSFSKSIRTVATALGKLDTNDVEKLSSFSKALALVPPAIGLLTKSHVERLSGFSKSLRSIATALGKLAKSHVDRLSGLAKAITLVTPAIESLNTDKFVSFFKSLRSTTSALGKLTKGHVDRLSSFAKALTLITPAIGGLDADKFVSFSKSIRSISTALENLTKGHVDNLASFAKKLGAITPVIGEALGKLGTSKFASFSKGLGTISTALKKLDASHVNNLSGFAKGLGAVIPQIDGAVGKLSKNKFANFAKGLGTISNASKKLDASHINNLVSFAKGLSTVTSKIGKSLAKLNVDDFASFSRSIRYVSDSLTKLDTSHTSKLKNLSQALKAFTSKIKPEKLKQAGDAMRSMFTGLSGVGGGGGGGSRGGLGVTHRGLGELAAAISPLTIAFVTLTRIFRNFIQLFKVFSEFEFTMARVGGVTRTVGHEFQRLTDFAREMGATTIFTATDAAQAMETLGRLGFTAAEILSALPGVLNVAAGEGMRLADAARIVAVNLNAFNLQASDTGRVTNVLAAASISSAASMKDLGIGLRTVASFAHTAGIEIEETVTMLSKLSDAGLTPFRASVALRQLLLQMQVPARAGAIDQLDRMSLRVADINPKVVGLTQAIATLKQRMTEFNVDANRVFTIRASQAFQVLSQVGARALGEFEQAITGTNTAAMLATRQMDTLHGSFRKLVSVWQEMQIGLGTALVPLIRTFTDVLAGLIRMFARLSDGQQRFIANTFSMIAGLILLTQTLKLTRKIFGAAGKAFLGFSTSVITKSGLMRASAIAGLTPWKAIPALMKVLTARVVAFGVAASAALGPWGLVAAGVVAAITATIGTLIIWRRRAEREREKQALQERERLRNEINMRGLLLQRLNEQARYQHERSFLPEEREQVKQLAESVGILNLQFNESGRIIGSTKEEINKLSDAMRKAETHSKILSKIEAFRSRQGKVVFDLEERVSLKAFADEIGNIEVKFNKLGEAIFKSAEHQREFMELMTEFRRQGEIKLTGQDITSFQVQRATMIDELAKAVVGPFKPSYATGLSPGASQVLSLRQSAAHEKKIAAMTQQLSAMLSVTELSTVGTEKIEDFLKTFPVKARGNLLTMVNLAIGVTKQIDDAQLKRSDLEAEKGIVNPFAAPPPIDNYTKGFLESMNDIAKQSEMRELKISAMPLDQPLASHNMMLAAYEDEIKALKELRKHRDAANFPEELWDIELAIIRKEIDYKKLIARNEEQTLQKRVRLFEVSLQTMSRGARVWGIQRIEANRYMLHKMADQAREFEEFRPGTYNKFRKAIDDLAKAKADKLKQTAQDAAKAYREELQNVTKAVSTADYQGLFEQRKILTSLELELQGTDAFEFASDLGEKLEDEVIAAFKNINKKLEGMFREGLLGQISIESANLADIGDVGLLQGRMEQVKEIQRSVFEDDLYNQFPDLQKDISEAVATAIRSMMDRMAALAKSGMMEDVEADMGLEVLLEKYEDVIAVLGDGFDMTDVVKAIADKTKERREEMLKSLDQSIKQAYDELETLTLQQLRQKKGLYSQFEKIAQGLGMSVNEFFITYGDILKGINDQIKRLTDEAKSEAAIQKLREQGLLFSPAGVGITPAGLGSVQSELPAQAGTARTTLGQELRGAYQAPVFGYRNRSQLQVEALREQLNAVQRQEQEHRDRLQAQNRGAARGQRAAVGSDPRVLRFKKEQRAIEDQIKMIERQTEAYNRFREATENITNILFDSFSSLSNWIKTEGGKTLLSGLNVFDQFDLGKYIEKLGVSYGTLTDFFDTFGASMQQSSSIVDFTGKVFSSTSKSWTRHINIVAASLSGLPGAIQQGLGLGGGIATVAGGILGGAAGFLGSGGAFSAQGAALGASLGSSLYSAVSGRGGLEEEVDGSTNVATTRGPVNVKRQNINIANINNEVTINTETVDDQLVDEVAERLGDRLDSNLTAADGGL